MSRHTERSATLRSAGWSWSGVRKKYYYLVGGWRLVLEQCEKEIL